MPQTNGEDHRRCGPHGRPKERFLKAHYACPPMKDAKIEPQENQYAANETEPVPRRDLNEDKHAKRKERGSVGAWERGNWNAGAGTSSGARTLLSAATSD